MTRFLTTAALLSATLAAPLAAQQADTIAIQPPAQEIETTRANNGYFPTDRAIHTPRAQAIFDRIRAENDN